MLKSKMKKPYKKREKDNKEVIAQEPVMNYRVQDKVRSQLSFNAGENVLPEELIISMAEYAIEARKEGQMILHDDVYDVLASKLGWK